jgi:glyoxylase-like metal-dependent hydrolase (beta-lactamase superfamily II)
MASQRRISFGVVEALKEVAPGIHRLGDWFVNWYLVEDEGEITIVDAGDRDHWRMLGPALESLGVDPGKVTAVVLTHADVDHIGFAEQARRELGAHVYLHEDAAPYAEGKERTREGRLWRYVRHPEALRLAARFAMPGRQTGAPVRESSKFRDGDVLEVPGRPRVIHTPGHAPGHSSFLFEDRGVLVSGDALITWSPLTGRRGPQIMSSGLNHDTDEAMRSLDRLEGVEADTLLPGHGEPWHGKLAAALERAREAGRS